MKSYPPEKIQYLENLQSKIKYSFKNNDLLIQSLTHRSFSARNNERLEFVGDAILDYTIARMLFDAFAHMPEGNLSRLRANLVNQESLAQIARTLELGNALQLGVGELKSGGHNRASILSDALEALFAAVSLDADFAASEEVIRRLFEAKIATISPDDNLKDAKTQLQEFLQNKHLALPVYRINKIDGIAPHQIFTVGCDLGEMGKIFTAQASSRREAEQKAAQDALKFLLSAFGDKK